MSQLKSNPSASVKGMLIKLDASESIGEITKYGWQLDISSPTGSTVTYSPNSSHKGADFVIITASVIEPGEYQFGLTVYDKDNNSDYATVNVVIK